MYSACRRLPFQVRLNKPVPTVCLTKLPRDGFLVILLIFPIHFFFSSIFAAFAIQTKFIFSCDGITLLNQDGFGRNWIYCASRFRKIAAGIKKYFLPKKRFHASFSSQLSRLSRFLKVLFTYNLKNPIFDKIETKLTSEMEKEKPFIFAGFGLPTRSCLFCFIWWHFPDRRVSGKTPRTDHTWQNPPPLS